jgi:hypothetical protein
VVVTVAKLQLIETEVRCYCICIAIILDFVSSDQVLNLLFLDGSHWYYKTINLLQLD